MNDQAKASAAVAKAVKCGQLPRLSKVKTKCVDCGKRATQYDHRDYSKPLDVDPVCSGCNKRRGPARNWIPRDSGQIMVNLPVDLVDELHSRAAAEGRFISAVFELAVRRGLAIIDAQRPA